MNSIFQKIYRTLLLLVTCCLNSLGQQVITISDADIRDAVVRRDLRSGYEYIMDTNYGNDTRLSSIAWSNSSMNTFWRSLVYFDLTDIPKGSTIQSATLYLYSDPAASDPNDAFSNSKLSGSNAIFIEKLINDWSDKAVTWNNQPATITTGRISVGASTSATENLQVNITSFVQEWVNNPVSNYGLKTYLQNETRYRARNYASTNHSNTAIHPKVIVTYTLPTSIASDCDTPDPTEEEMKALPWYGNETFLDNYYDSLVQIYSGPFLQSVDGDVEYPWLSIPVQFWIYQISNGNPGGNTVIFPTELGLQQIMDNLNNAFRYNGINLRFYIANVSYVNNESALEISGDIEMASLATANRNSNAINCHIVNGGTPGKYIAVPTSIFIPRTTAFYISDTFSFTHEVGHFLGLPHTHAWHDWVCLREPVTRGYKLTACIPLLPVTKRCLYTGDLFCDTDADPKINVNGHFEANCTWNADGLKDQYGDVFHPDPRNYMAYGERSCRANFSNSQRKAMIHKAFKKQSTNNWYPTNGSRFDRFEPDDNDITARLISVGTIQSRTFHTSGRTDNVDWLKFQHPPTGSLYNYQLIINQLSPGAVGEVKIYNLNTTSGSAAARVTGITSSTVGAVTTYTIPCNILTSAKTYLIEVPRAGSGTLNYDLEFKADVLNPVSVSGPLAICSNNATFIANNIPSGASITWSKSSNVTYVSGQGTPNYTVIAGSSGAAWIQAVIVNGCGSVTIKKDVQNGILSGTLTGTAGVCPGQLYTYTAVVPGGHKPEYAYNWTLLAGWTIAAKFDNVLVASPGSNFGGGVLGYTVTNSCGTSALASITVYRTNCSSSVAATSETSLLVYPNPAESSPVTIETASVNSEADQGSTTRTIQEIVLIDKLGVVKKRIKLENAADSKANLELSDLPSGIYLLSVFNGQEWKTSRLVN